MKMKFAYYNDEDFGLTEYPEIEVPSKEEFEDEKEYLKIEKENNNYVKFLITGIMEDFQDYEQIEDFLNSLKDIKNGKRKYLEWDGQAFQYKISKSKVEFEHTIFEICDEYPKWSCKFKEFESVLKGWKKFLELPKDEKSKVEVEF